MNDNRIEPADEEPIKAAYIPGYNVQGICQHFSPACSWLSISVLFEWLLFVERRADQMYECSVLLQAYDYYVQYMYDRN